MNDLFLKSIIRKIIIEGEIKSAGGLETIKQIAGLAKKWIFKNYKDYDNQPIDSLEEVSSIEIPLNRILNYNSKDIANGSIFVLLFNILNVPEFSPKFIEKYDKEKLSFDSQFVDSFKNRTVKITVVFHKRPPNKMADWAGEINRLRMDPYQIVMGDHDNSEPDWSKLDSIIRHELQHMSQTLNTAAINYGSQLNKIKDPTKIKKYIGVMELSDTAYGVGKQTTGLRQYDPESGNNLSKKIDPKDDTWLRSILENPKLVTYLGDDFEYNTWKSDTLDAIMKTLIASDKEVMNKINLKLFLDSFSGKPAQLAAYIKQNPGLKNIYQIMLKNPTQIASGANDYAVKIIKELMDDPRKYARNSDNFIVLMKKLRPQEFVKNISSELTKRISEYAKNNNLIYLAQSGENESQQRGLGKMAAAKQKAAAGKKQYHLARVAELEQSKNQSNILAKARTSQEIKAQQALGISPFNPRRMSAEDNFDDNTGYRIVKDPKEYNRQIQQYLSTLNSSRAITEKILKNLLNQLTLFNN